jgi:cysteinyl-tRNA synthetase
LAEKVFGGQAWHGRVLRLAMLGTHYRQPIDWTVDRLVQTKATLMEWARMLHGEPAADAPDGDVMAALEDDLNTPAAMAAIYGLASAARTNAGDRQRLKRTLWFLGLYADERDADFAVGTSVDAAKVEDLIAQRNAARKAKNFAEADRLRGEISALGVAIEDGPKGTTWKVVS